MAEQTNKKTRRKPRSPKRTYIHRPNAVCITIHSQDGSAVPRKVLDEAAQRVLDVAAEHNLLINLAEV